MPRRWRAVRSGSSSRVSRFVALLRTAYTVFPSHCVLHTASTAAFVNYAMAHWTRKSYTNVKVQLMLAGVSPLTLTAMDSGFMFTYAGGSFITGQVTPPPHAARLDKSHSELTLLLPSAG